MVLEKCSEIYFFFLRSDLDLLDTIAKKTVQRKFILNYIFVIVFCGASFFVPVFINRLDLFKFITKEIQFGCLKESSLYFVMTFNTSCF